MGIGFANGSFEAESTSDQASLVQPCTCVRLLYAAGRWTIDFWTLYLCCLVSEGGSLLSQPSNPHVVHVELMFLFIKPLSRFLHRNATRRMIP